MPCHRVLPGTGKLGNYGGGPERKRALLELEGALLLADRPFATRDRLDDDLGGGLARVGSAWMPPIFVATSMPFGDLAQQRVVGRERRGARRR